METETKALCYVPVPEEIAQEARRTLRDRFGHQLKVVKEHGPCRVCLRISKTPDDFILLSYQPLPDSGPYAEIGPIFVHARTCEPYANAHEFPSDFTSRRLVLRAYDAGGNIVDAAVAEPGDAPRIAEALFTSDGVAEVHLRHESYTCFDFKIVRTSVSS